MKQSLINDYLKDKLKEEYPGIDEELMNAAFEEAKDYIRFVEADKEFWGEGE